MIRRGLAAGIVLAVILTAPALAAPEDVANDISLHVMSPYCPGVTLHDCPSDAAVALRARIADMAADGMTRSEIMATLVREFGPTIRAVPPASGSGLVAWLLPGLALVAGVMGAWILIRRWTTATASAPATVTTRVTAEERSLLDRELAKLRSRP